MRCHTDISLYLPITWLFWICSHWLHWKAKSSLWALAVSNGGYIIRCTWCHTDISLYLPICWGVTLTFPYIFLLLDCFKFALIDCIEKWRVHSELWQFQMGGYIVRCTWCHTVMSLYLPIIWLFWICSHWPHWKVKSSLWALAVSNGGVYGKMYLVSHWHVLISSYYLTVSNGLSLTTLKSEEFTLSSGSFEWGGLIVRFTLNLKVWAHFKFSLYLPIIWLFQMDSHWPHWKAKSSLWALAVLNGGVNHQIYPKSENLS